MTREEAIKILSPETTAAALAEIEYYNGFFGHTAKVQAVSEACDLAVEALKQISLDVVEVVRCKDCKHLSAEYRCVNWRGLYDYTKSDDFCSYGELKDGE